MFFDFVTQICHTRKPKRHIQKSVLQLSICNWRVGCMQATVHVLIRFCGIHICIEFLYVFPGISSECSIYIRVKWRLQVHHLCQAGISTNNSPLWCCKQRIIHTVRHERNIVHICMFNTRIRVSKHKNLHVFGKAFPVYRFDSFWVQKTRYPSPRNTGRNTNNRKNLLSGKKRRTRWDNPYIITRRRGENKNLVRIGRKNMLISSGNALYKGQIANMKSKCFFICKYLHFWRRVQKADSNRCFGFCLVLFYRAYFCRNIRKCFFCKFLYYINCIGPDMPYNGHIGIFLVRFHILKCGSHIAIIIHHLNEYIDSILRIHTRIVANFYKMWNPARKSFDIFHFLATLSGILFAAVVQLD